jgi:hypothetical protein
VGSVTALYNCAAELPFKLTMATPEAGISTYKYRGVIHAQGARIRAQGAPGYVHKKQAHKQAYKRGGRLTGVFTSQKGNSTSESDDDAKAVRTRRRAR